MRHRQRAPIPASRRASPCPESGLTDCHACRASGSHQKPVDTSRKHCGNQQQSQWEPPEAGRHEHKAQRKPAESSPSEANDLLHLDGFRTVNAGGNHQRPVDASRTQYVNAGGNHQKPPVEVLQCKCIAPLPQPVETGRKPQESARSRRMPENARECPRMPEK
eukprot:13000925-Alexandrium_andersonii.AAC.1